MLVKITSYCKMHCKHCMESADVKGEHMTEETFEAVLRFIKKYNLFFMMISGGEPTDHPLYLKFVKKAKEACPKVVVLSNGLFLQDERKGKFLSAGVDYQIINDPRYYPIKVEPVEHPSIVVFDNKIMAPVSPIGRAVENKVIGDRKAPLCFNYRSVVRSLGKFSEAVIYLRMIGKFCTPSITAEGNLVAGESRFCSVVGTVESSEEEIVERTIDLKCSKCGLVDNLTEVQKKAIGEI